MSEQSSQFPYRNASEGVLSAVLSDVEGMVIKLARDLNRRWFFTDDQLQELIQKCLIHLWRRSLPRYDNERNTKVSTYVHRCALRFFQLYMPREQRRLAKLEESLPNGIFDYLQAADESLDRRIEMLSKSILEDPSKYLTEQQAAVLRAITDHPKLSKKEIAKMLGYEFPASLSHIIKRIRRTITQIDIEEHA